MTNTTPTQAGSDGYPVMFPWLIDVPEGEKVTLTAHLLRKALRGYVDSARAMDASRVAAQPSHDDLYDILRGTGYMTRDQCDECVTAILVRFGTAPPAADGGVPALVQFRKELRAAVDASIDVSADIAHQEGGIDTADHFLARFDQLFPEVQHVSA